jgi:hypothetical protein
MHVNRAFCETRLSLLIWFVLWLLPASSALQILVRLGSRWPPIHGPPTLPTAALGRGAARRGDRASWTNVAGPPRASPLTTL